MNVVRLFRHPRAARHALLAGLGALALVAVSAQAQAPDASDIVERANQAAFYAGDDGRSEARMHILDGSGREQVRQFTLLRRDGEDGRQRYLVTFSRPADVRGTVFLVHKNPGADDDRWLYLPGLDLVRRIAPGDKRTSFVGSHVFYEDVSGRHLEDDTHELIETTDEHYVVKSTPKAPGSVEFAHFTTWIDRDTWLPMRSEYTRADGHVYRRMQIQEVQEIDGYPTGTRMRMEDLNSGGHTLVEFRFSAYDLGIPESVFTERSLRNPPRQWLERQ
ncbi:outer membrane lipoprotein-sorting protein [Halomonas sp. DQ26W]|uniref:outer membrane lipoprotein-sorting protein n=1 Tax=Halomonas sp. DQ26W TaxID=2282311 RepID=UPI000DF722A1|nr:outer membrane lipoprotein-sorting protein [Halomonas sp. DQ26W]RDB41875.1 outer membrane lipoprotein-sorting protein [Halomonas sp. DQ26W]RDB42381.1 outer membrane lipoprotein-sorting protein [Halomonas sp. DQ26W]